MEDFEEEIVVEEPIERKVETKNERKFDPNNTPILLALISLALTFLKDFFSIVLTYGTAYKVLTIIFFSGAVATALVSMFLIIFKKKRLEITTEFLISIISIAIAFI